MSSAPAEIHHVPPPPGESPGASPKKSSRIRRVVTGTFGALLALVLAAELALQLPPVREAIRGRAEAKLAKRWPGATIARCAAADVTGVVRFDGVRLPLIDRASEEWERDGRRNAERARIDVAGVVLDGLEVSVRLRPLFRGHVVPASIQAADTYVEANVPRMGTIALTADEGAQLALTVVELPQPDGEAPARVRLAGPSRACLPSGRCLAANAFLEAEAVQEDAGGIRVRWQALADGVQLRSNEPFEPPIELPPLAAHGEATRTGSVAALDASVSVGPHGTVTAKATSSAGKFRLEVTSSTESYAALLDSIPLGIPPEAILGVDGPLRATAKISGPIADPDAWEIQARLNLAEIRATPRNVAAGRPFVEPFLYRPNADPAAPATWMGTKNPDFLPLSLTPEVVIRSVLLAEDSFFFTHPGFDVNALVGAAKTNLKEQRVHRGGSTISQQLAKNLWLSRDRTMLRKMQEALLTVSLEAAVPKDRILEIYLNGIEWGPGIYGVKRASRHYFAKDPSELTPKEAAYLATIIPNPRKYYGYFRKGAVSPNWEERVMFLVGKLYGAGIIDEAAYEEAEWTPLRFASTGDDPWTEEVESATVVPLDDEEE